MIILTLYSTSIIRTVQPSFDEWPDLTKATVRQAAKRWLQDKLGMEGLTYVTSPDGQSKSYGVPDDLLAEFSAWIRSLLSQKTSNSIMAKVNDKDTSLKTASVG